MKILVFGNSGSGKSTLAKSLCQSNSLSHLDLDKLAWLPTKPPRRMPLADSKTQIEQFIASAEGWVIEGCYTDLLELAVPFASEVRYLKIPIEECIENAKARPWEPHKYPSKTAQDENLDMLINWISNYSNRSDTFSESSHQKLYDEFTGEKSICLEHLKKKPTGSST